MAEAAEKDLNSGSPVGIEATILQSDQDSLVPVVGHCSSPTRLSSGSAGNVSGCPPLPDPEAQEDSSGVPTARVCTDAATYSVKTQEEVVGITAVSHFGDMNVPAGGNEKQTIETTPVPRSVDEQLFVSDTGLEPDEPASVTQSTNTQLFVSVTGLGSTETVSRPQSGDAQVPIAETEEQSMKSLPVPQTGDTQRPAAEIEEEAMGISPKLQLSGDLGRPHLMAGTSIGNQSTMTTSPPSSPTSPPPSPSDTQGIFTHLQKALTANTVDSLERHMTTGLDVLQEIVPKLSTAQGGIDAIRWLQSVKDLIGQPTQPQTILGVMGNTGEGKSSLINALLEEDRLAPTNGMQACTAVVTEFSWNDSNDPKQLYTAEIEFITADDWRLDLGYLYGDMVSATGELSTEGNLKESDAGIAWAKVQAVYPHISKESLVQTNMDELANHPTVLALLGTTKIVHHAFAEELRDEIRQYADSKQRHFVKDSQGASERRPQLWPLVKVVRIRTKADILSTGAVLVDLPGVQDSNAARATIAEKYKEKCDGIWVVANINRAIDNKTARNLLGQSFKQQLKFDGNYSKVTFICSQIDNINVAEAVDTLGNFELVQHYEHYEQVQREVERWRTQAKPRLVCDQKRLDAISAYSTELEKRLDRWEKLLTTVNSGRLARVPKETSKKRKAVVPLTTTRKRRRVEPRVEATEETSRYVDATDLWDSMEENIPKFAEDQALSAQDAQSMIDHLKTLRQTASEAKSQLVEKIEVQQTEEFQLQDQQELSYYTVVSECISKRSEYSSRAIREDYALGLKELDQENAQRENPDAFDPEKEMRDYGQIARSLPVFCVSSKAYQSIVTSPEDALDGFEEPEDTGIPQLRSHAKMLTEAARIENSRLFLNGLLQTLNSLLIWSCEKEPDICMTADERKCAMDRIKMVLSSVHEDLRTAAAEFVQASRRIISDLFAKYKTSTKVAAKRAPLIAARWPSQKRGDGGLPYVSYKATCRRWGAFTGRLGKRDFNEELAAPLKQGLGNKWETTFTRKIPATLEAFSETLRFHLQNLDNFTKDEFQHQASFTSINMIRGQISACVDGLVKMVERFGRDISASQKEASRDFEPAIEQQMAAAYNRCANDGGQGVFRRIQDYMMNHIETQGLTLYMSSGEPVQKKLGEMCDSIQRELETHIATMLDRLNADYARILVGADITEDSKEVRRQVSQFLKDVDDRFHRAAPESLEA
ncbi:hypothetical protein GGR56DRAFT_276587 [Xylariaceae sp. FL0804]|nr:hypothetical protein GGR56DRAFT_276587 [Xylariaceae sp. FL0804]